jgi:hypothetical protein
MDCRTKIAQEFEQATGRPPPDTGHVEVWAAQSYDLTVCASVVAEGLARKPDIIALKYFDRRLAELHQRTGGNGAAPATAKPETEEAKRRRMYEYWLRVGDYWPGSWGPSPGAYGCPIPDDLLVRWLLETARDPAAPDHVAPVLQQVCERLRRHQERVQTEAAP